MNPLITDVDSFLSHNRKELLIIDVRSESEFEKGHIPGAVSLPLLNNEHRVIIGTIYKQQGREQAVLKGFELVGPLFSTLISKASEMAGSSVIGLYCWRGGMRSNIMAWLLQLAGFKIILLEGGYKSYRKRMRDEFIRKRKVIVLGGKTGSGKTKILELLQASGEQVLNLELLANHKGSTYGGLGMPPPPSQEHFENLLGSILMQSNPEEIIWIENESRNIGYVNLPDAIYALILNAKVIELVVPEEVRRQHILSQYGGFTKEELISRTVRIGKRLGGQHLKYATQGILDDNYDAWLDVVLYYYDRTYQFGNAQRKQDTIVQVETDLNEEENLLLKLKLLSRELEII